MFAAPLSWMPGVYENWGPETPDPSRQRVVCGSITLTKASSYCFSHYQPEPEQGQATKGKDEPPEANVEPFGRGQGDKAPEVIVEFFCQGQATKGKDELPEFTKQYANQLREELREGSNKNGRPLTAEQVCSHLARLRRRVLVMPARYRDAELAKIRELEVIAKERLEIGPR